MFRKLRIAILLIILVFVALNTVLDRFYSRSWQGPLQVALFPVNADGSKAATEFIRQLQPEDLQPLEAFFNNQAKLYYLPVDRPLRFTLAPVLSEPPPLPPEQGGVLVTMMWSLHLRWFTWRTPNPPGPTPTIRMFMLFHDPARANVLQDSTGLEKGLVGIAHLFASNSMARANLVIVAHELLHTLSATDKYDLETNLPVYPEGYAEPERQPRYPQERAELMAGRIAVSANRAEQADSLQQVMIGPITAREIGWDRAP
ncbi:MAG: hypothetical protein QM808_01110 [Steroidobacteraceae bacterium]